MVVMHGFVYQIYPNKTEIEKIHINIGHSRFIYNTMLALQEDNHKKGIKLMSKIDMNNYVNRILKTQHPWLKDADKFSLTNSVYDLHKAYESFFNHNADHPNFKNKRKCKLSYSTNFTNNNIEVGKDYVKIPKVGKVKAIIHRPLPDGAKIKGLTVTENRDGTFVVSVLCQYEVEDITLTLDPNKVLALDYKSNGLYVDQHGNSCNMPHFMRKSEKKLIKEQHKLSHMIESHIIGYTKGSKGGRKPIYDKDITECKNIQKQRLKVARIHRHIANQRKDFLQKLSTEIANQYDAVVVETLNMKAMSNKAFGNGKATMDNGYGMFLKMLEYKLTERGKTLIFVDKWFPSSQLCSCCGHKHKKIKDLTIRNWTCPSCNTNHDRDINAARNIYKEGIKILNERHLLAA